MIRDLIGKGYEISDTLDTKNTLEVKGTIDLKLIGVVNTICFFLDRENILYQTARDIEFEIIRHIPEIYRSASNLLPTSCFHIHYVDLFYKTTAVSNTGYPYMLGKPFFKIETITITKATFIGYGT